jgi:hypothetical protein
MSFSIYGGITFNSTVSTWDRKVVTNAPPNAIMSAFTIDTDLKDGKEQVFAENQTWNFSMASGPLAFLLFKDNKNLIIGESGFFLNGRRAPAGNFLGAKVHFKCMNLIISGVEYRIPDVWWSTGYGGAGHYICSNWRRYDPMLIGDSAVAGAKISLYAYENGCYGDTSHPVELELSVDGHNVGVKKLRNLTFDSPGDFVDEINYKLAATRYEKGFKSVAANSLLSGVYANVDPSKLVIDTPPYKANLKSVSMNVITESVASTAEKDYVSATTLRNATNAAVTMKTSDYAHTVTETFTFTAMMAVKAGLSMSIKETAKFKEDIIIEKAEVAVEETLTATFEVTDTFSKSWTKTDTKTFTVSGQTISVPPKSVLSVETEWWRAKISGVTEIFFPLEQSPTALVYVLGDQNALNTPATAELKMLDCAKSLDLKSVKTSAIVGDKRVDGGYLSGRFPFTCEVGVMATYSVSEEPYIDPVAT